MLLLFSIITLSSSVLVFWNREERRSRKKLRGQGEVRGSEPESQGKVSQWPRPSHRARGWSHGPSHPPESHHCLSGHPWQILPWDDPSLWKWENKDAMHDLENKKINYFRIKQEGTGDFKESILNYSIDTLNFLKERFTFSTSEVYKVRKKQSELLVQIKQLQ